jgi:hypothetical protein
MEAADHFADRASRLFVYTDVSQARHQRNTAGSFVSHQFRQETSLCGGTTFPDGIKINRAEVVMLVAAARRIVGSLASGSHVRHLHFFSDNVRAVENVLYDHAHA